jgi:hypothetical protein
MFRYGNDSRENGPYLDFSLLICHARGFVTQPLLLQPRSLGLEHYLTCPDLCEIGWVALEGHTLCRED